MGESLLKRMDDPRTIHGTGRAAPNQEPAPKTSVLASPWASRGWIIPGCWRVCARSSTMCLQPSSKASISPRTRCLEPSAAADESTGPFGKHGLKAKPFGRRDEGLATAIPWRRNPKLPGDLGCGIRASAQLAGRTSARPRELVDQGRIIERDIESEMSAD